MDSKIMNLISPGLTILPPYTQKGYCAHKLDKFVVEKLVSDLT